MISLSPFQIKRPSKRRFHIRRVLLGLVRVTGPTDNAILGGCKGAYVTIVAKARNDVEFSKLVRKEAGEIGLVVDRIEWIEAMGDRLERFDIEEFILVLAEEVEKEGGCRFGVFHAWEE